MSAWVCVPAFCGFRTCQTFGAGPLVVCSLLLSALSLCLWCVGFEYGLISRFKGVLARFCGVCVGLCGFVWLACFAWLVGLLYACGVRRFKGLWRVCLRFSSFALVFASFYARCPSLLWLSFFVLLHCLCGSLGVVVVSFSLSDYTQKERAQVLASSLVLLWACLYV